MKSPIHPMRLPATLLDNTPPREGIARRGFLQSMAGGLYGAALASLAGATTVRTAFGAHTSAQPRVQKTDFEPKAKCVIQLFMHGGPSQMDLFDPKPMLDKHHGEAYFDKLAGEVEFAAEAGALMRSPFKFAQHGQSGMWISDAMPHLTTQADELCFIRSMQTVNTTHEPAIYKIHSGQMLPGYPTMGAARLCRTR
jgi:hypothetical protein